MQAAERRACVFCINRIRRLNVKAVKCRAFFRGVHPHDMKHLSNKCGTEVMPAPEVAAISCSQSLGRPAVPVVEIGQDVSIGEVIARQDGAISSDVFASICGKVTDIKDMVGASGAMEKFIFIKNDGREDTKFFEPLKEDELTPDSIKQRIRDCGIVGLGGAGFPVAIKISPKSPVDTLIINGAECEPYLTCDHRLMLEHTDEIVRGARYIAKSLHVTNIIIGIEANKPDCIAAFEPYEDIQPVILKKRYPMGGEKQLIYVCTGRKVGLGKLPADSGVVVQNVATCFASCEAIELGKPHVERIVTVTGKAVANPKNLWVRIGTSIREIVEYCGGEKVKPLKVVQGGPMTGLASPPMTCTPTRPRPASFLCPPKRPRGTTPLPASTAGSARKCAPCTSCP